MHVEIPHHCGRTHRGYQSLASCNWPDGASVVGDGPFALLSRCDPFTVTLYETRAEARRRLRALDQRGCGRTCAGRHELTVLVGDVDPLAPLPPRDAPSAVEWLRS